MKIVQMPKLLLIILTLTASCQSTQNLEGIWEMDYSTRKNKILFSYESTLIDFTSDSISFVQIGDNESGIFDTIIVNKNSFLIEDSVVRIESLEGLHHLKLHSIHADSLSFSFNGTDDILVAKKLQPLTGKRISKNDLSGLGFEVLNGEHYHKLDFINDSILFVNGYHSLDSWTITTYKEFDFLNTTGSFFPKVPLIISGDRIIALINKGQDFSIFRRLIPQRKKSEFIGKWVEYGREPQPPILLKVDTIRTLHIDEDSIKIQHFEKIKSYAFGLNTEGTVIHFANSPYKHYWNPRTPMEVLKLTNDELILLERRIGDSTIIRYKRSNIQK